MTTIDCPVCQDSRIVEYKGEQLDCPLCDEHHWYEKPLKGGEQDDDRVHVPK